VISSTKYTDRDFTTSTKESSDLILGSGSGIGEACCRCSPTGEPDVDILIGGKQSSCALFCFVRGSIDHEDGGDFPQYGMQLSSESQDKIEYL